MIYLELGLRKNLVKAGYNSLLHSFSILVDSIDYNFDLSDDEPDVVDIPIMAASTQPKPSFPAVNRSNKPTSALTRSNIVPASAGSVQAAGIPSYRPSSVQSAGIASVPSANIPTAKTNGYGPQSLSNGSQKLSNGLSASKTLPDEVMTKSLEQTSSNGGVSSRPSIDRNLKPQAKSQPAQVQYLSLYVIIIIKYNVIHNKVDVSGVVLSGTVSWHICITYIISDVVEARHG